jgi:hypothetical protein
VEKSPRIVVPDLGLPERNTKTMEEQREEGIAREARDAQLRESNPDIEREVGEMMKAELARIEQEEDEAQMAARVDLFKIIQEEKGKPLMERQFRLLVANWNILIEMVKVRDKMGLFHKTEQQMAAENHLSVVGRVLLCGPTALSGETESGINLALVAEGISTPDALEGMYVVIQRYVGNDMYFAPMPGKKLRYITASEILAVTPIAGLWIKQ